MRLLGFETRWMRAILLATLPDADRATIRVPNQRRIDAYLRDFMAIAPALSGLGVRLAIWAITCLPIFWRLRPFAMLRPTDQLLFLEWLERSNVYALRELPTLIKMIGAFVILADPAAKKALGVVGDDGTWPAWACEPADGPGPTRPGRSPQRGLL